jgi:hypothetical protein
MAEPRYPSRVAELTPRPECATVAIGTCMMAITQMWTPDDIKGTHLEDLKQIAAWAGVYIDAGTAFYLEYLKCLKKNGIQPHFPLAHVHQLEIVERLILHGAYMGPLRNDSVGVEPIPQGIEFSALLADKAFDSDGPAPESRPARRSGGHSAKGRPCGPDPLRFRDVSLAPPG